MIMSDLGADVIKVEQPGLGDYARSAPPFIKDTGAAFLMLNRNKRSITLNLKKPEAQEVVHKLSRHSDVLIESFRPGVADKLGVGYPTISEINSRMVYCSLSGYGQTGPYRDLVGHDLTYMAYSGTIGATGLKGGPPIIPAVQIADIQGALYATIAVMAALCRREKTGEGEFIDISLMDVAVASMIMPFSFHFGGFSTDRGQILLSGAAPFYSVYATADDKFIAVASLEPKFWVQLCEALKLEKYRDDQLAMGEDAERIRQDLAVVFRQKSREEWVRILNEREVPCAPVYDVREVAGDPQVKSRNMLFETETEKFGKLNQLATPIRMSRNPLTMRLPPPRLGEHTFEILQELGYSVGEAKRLEAVGAV
jgi:crotonobetainyl-CoA:carnitine CoA-transferase CaiB-like acyl-CoA transferase